MNTSWTMKRGRRYPPLEKDLETDVVIVGGGLAGVLTAYALSRQGKDVVVLEKESLGSDATVQTTAFITHVVDTDLSTLTELFGARRARLVWESGAVAIRLIERLIKRERLDCEFMRCPVYVFANSKKQLESLEEECAVARKRGFPLRVVRDQTLGFDNLGHVKIPDQAKFHPLKFLQQVAKKAAARGVRIFEKTEVAAATGRGPVRIRTAKGNVVSARDVVIATYDPFNKPGELFAKKGMYNSYVLEARVPRQALPEGLFWDRSNPYYYFRVDRRSRGDRIILGGGDHRSGLPVKEAKAFARLRSYLRSDLGVRDFEIVRKWVGPVLEPSDGIALIGRYKPHYYVSTGFSGNGMTYSAIAARLIADSLLGRKNPWTTLYDPRRARKLSQYARKGMDYASEFYGGAWKTFFS